MSTAHYSLSSLPEGLVHIQAEEPGIQDAGVAGIVRGPAGAATEALLLHLQTRGQTNRVSRLGLVVRRSLGW